MRARRRRRKRPAPEPDANPGEPRPKRPRRKLTRRKGTEEEEAKLAADAMEGMARHKHRLSLAEFVLSRVVAPGNDETEPGMVAVEVNNNTAGDAEDDEVWAAIEAEAEAEWTKMFEFAKYLDDVDPTNEMFSFADS
jgi:hypothetical protein